ncbi:MAG: bifunctional hydroxymethylpyrimidine kinase/phosphomethylpyrimidine kinase [Acidobacteriota bacterium]|jgi:hydroxymethylpyrimidine/phosphomethylpyrimidine kinase
MNRTILTISAFDSSGADGIAADLKTYQAFRVYGAAAVTAVGAQSTVGLQALHPIPIEIMGQQIESVATDMPVHGVKLGLLPTAAHVEMVATLLKALSLEKFLVVDPVLKSESGVELLDPEAVEALKKNIIPMAYVLTPNLEEAEILSGVPVKDMNGAKAAAKVIRELGCENVVVTGGHLEGPRAMDLWYDGSHQRIFDGSKIVTRNTLGMGTTFASIVAASLVKGLALGECIEKAKQYIAKATQHPFEIGKGSGPLNHTVPM